MRSSTSGLFLGVLVFLCLSLWVPAACQAVIFAEDVLILFEDGVRVTDDSVLHIGKWTETCVCKGGVGIVGQQDLERTFARTPEVLVQTFQEWWNSLSKERRDAVPTPNYRKDYLDPILAKSLYSVTITFLPSEGGAPPDDPDMTGGRVGNPRIFRVDLKKKVAEEIAETALTEEEALRVCDARRANPY